MRLHDALSSAITDDKQATFPDGPADSGIELSRHS
jgi:hypothetical protein